MANSRQYLEWHGQQWRVRVKVPARVRDLIGRSKLTFPLHTADLKEAEERKWAVVARLKSAIAAADKALLSEHPIEAEALRHRLFKDDDATQYAVHERAKHLETTKGYDAAKAFYDLASGQVTPLDHHADAFVAHQGYRKKSEGDLRRTLGWLSDWLRDSHLPVALEAVTRKAAGRFILERLAVGRSTKKAGAYLAFLRQYALSGMRLEEICQLLVADCQGGLFSVWAGKTDNARRTVPIHSDLVGIVERRTKGKKPGDFLIEDLPPLSNSRETRSDPAAKRFTRYRRKMKVDERPNGKAKSNIDFHSFRRWFIRKVRGARLGGATGFDEWTLTWVIGHTDTDRPKSLDLSQAGYAGQDPEKTKRALVESVKLPNSKPTKAVA